MDGHNDKDTTGRQSGRIGCAFEVDIEDMSTVIFAHSVGSAKMAAVVGWRDAGYGSDGRWPQSIRARRKPLLDRAARFLKIKKPYLESYVRELC